MGLKYIYNGKLYDLSGAEYRPGNYGTARLHILANGSTVDYGFTNSTEAKSYSPLKFRVNGQNFYIGRVFTSSSSKTTISGTSYSQSRTNYTQYITTSISDNISSKTYSGIGALQSYSYSYNETRTYSVTADYRTGVSSKSGSYTSSNVPSISNNYSSNDTYSYKTSVNYVSGSYGQTATQTYASSYSYTSYKLTGKGIYWENTYYTNKNVNVANNIRFKTTHGAVNYTISKNSSYTLSSNNITYGTSSITNTSQYGDTKLITTLVQQMSTGTNSRSVALAGNSVQLYKFSVSTYKYNYGSTFKTEHQILTQSGGTYITSSNYPHVSLSENCTYLTLTATSITKSPLVRDTNQSNSTTSYRRYSCSYSYYTTVQSTYKTERITERSMTISTYYTSQNFNK